MSWTNQVFTSIFNDIATKFSETTTYAVGDYVLYDAQLYKCTTAHPAGAWDATHFTVVTIASQFGSGASVDYAPVAKAFSTATAYTTGALVIYEGKLYKANENIPAGSWQSDKWTQTWAVEEAGDVSSKLDSTSMAPAYSSSSTYEVGALCTKDGVLYECNTAITTPEAWTAAHWTATDATEQFSTADMSMVAAEYNSASAYGVGKYVTHEGKLYRCISYCSGGTFDPSLWSECEVMSTTSNWNAATNNNLAPEYSESETYNTGDLVVKANTATGTFTLYKAKEDGITGTWNSDKWTATKLSVALDSQWASYYPAYVAGVYSIGSRIMKNNKYYMAKQNTSATFDSSEWLEVNPEAQAASELTALLNAVGMTRTVTYDSTLSKFSYSFAVNI